MFLWSNNVDFFSVVECFANEGNILETEQSHILSKNLFSSSQGMLRLPVESTLSEDWSDQTSIFQVILDVSKNLWFSLGWRANNHNVWTWDDVGSFARYLIDFTNQISFWLPWWLGCVCDYFIVKDFRSSRHNVDLPFGVEMANCCDRGTGKIATTSKSYLEDRFHPLI